MQSLKAFIIFLFTLSLVSLSERATPKVRAKISPGPPLGLTGAPGEGTCIGCHYSYGGAQGLPNLGPGRVQLTGLPAFYTPGQSYTVTVTITANELTTKRWGFELTSLDAQGSSSSTGELTVTDAPRVLKRSAAWGDQTRVYLSHNDEAGTSLGRSSTNNWSFTWTAPDSSAGEIGFYVAGNAADGQVTPEGDYIYTTLALVKPPAPIVAAQALSGLSSYLSAADTSPVELRAHGNFGSNAQLIFNNIELPTQTVADGLTATIPASQLSSKGAYPVRVKLANGALTNALSFVLAAQLNSKAIATVDAASYNLAVTPGQIAALFGVELTNHNAPASASTLPLPRTLQGTTVYVNGVAVPLFFTSNGQLNFQVPYHTASGLASVIVVREDGTAAQGYVNVYPTAPALFTINAAGRGQAVALNADFTPNGDSAANARAKRATKGSYVVLFGTGTGALLSNDSGQALVPDDGEAASGDPLIVTTALPRVTIGGRAATVVFSGLAPGLVGLWQLNVQVPTDAPSGPGVEVLVSWGARTANPVALAIQ